MTAAAAAVDLHLVIAVLRGQWGRAQALGCSRTTACALPEPARVQQAPLHACSEPMSNSSSLPTHQAAGPAVRLIHKGHLHHGELGEELNHVLVRGGVRPAAAAAKENGRCALANRGCWGRQGPLDAGSVGPAACPPITPPFAPATPPPPSKTGNSQSLELEDLAVLTPQQRGLLGPG